MRRVVIVAFPGVQTLDVTGPAEVLRAAAAAPPARLRRHGRGARSGPAPHIHGDDRARQPLSACSDPIDTLIVAGGTGARAAEEDARLRRMAARGRRPRAAGHLGLHRRLPARRAPASSTVAAPPPTGPRAPISPRAIRRSWSSADPIFVRDGNVYTSAGVTAGMDLALALVEEDLGREVALETARWLVLFLQAPRRPGAVQRPARRADARTARRCASCRPGSPTTSTATSRCPRSHAGRT